MPLLLSLRLGHRAVSRQEKKKRKSFCGHSSYVPVRIWRRRDGELGKAAMEAVCVTPQRQQTRDEYEVESFTFS